MARVDFVFGDRLVVEVSGRLGHASDRDRQREDAALAAGLALPSFLTRAVHAAGEGVAADPAFANRVLVVIQLAGGNDGLNMVVPFADGRYHDLRKAIGLPDDKVLPLTDGMALNGSMTKLKGLWDQNHLAVVQGVGYPKPDLSHFRSKIGRAHV